MRFFAREEKKKMEDWLSVNTYGENLHVTQGVLEGNINMVVSSIEMADACRELMYKYKDKIQKYAVTYSGWPFINVQLEFKGDNCREDEYKLINEWDSYFGDNYEWIKRKVV